MHKMQARENFVWPHLERIDLHLDEEVNSSRVDATTAITSLTNTSYVNVTLWAQERLFTNGIRCNDVPVHASEVTMHTAIKNQHIRFEPFGILSIAKIQ